MGTTLKAEGHGVIDAVEDKALLLRQHVREAESALNRKRAKLDAMVAEGKALEREAERLKTRQTELERDIGLSLSNDKEELARHAIRQRLPIDRRLQQIVERGRTLTEGQQELRQLVGEQEAVFETLRARTRQYIEQGEQGSLDRPVVVTDEDVEMELLRRRAAGSDASENATASEDES
jgi:phage shock protein A